MATRRGFLLCGVAVLATAAWPAPSKAAPASRLAVPFVTQLDGTAYSATNCGPTSLAMVLRYFRRADGANPDTLRRALMRLPGGGYAADPSQGTAIQDLTALARQRGLRTIMGSGASSTGWTLDRVAQELSAGHPLIVLTRLNALPGWSAAPDNFDHWIVLTGVVGETYVYNDPAHSSSSWGANRLIGGVHLSQAMRLATVPSQGAAFASFEMDGEFPIVAAELPPDRPTARVVVNLVRLGNGALGARPPVRIQFTPDGQQIKPEGETESGSLWDLAGPGRFVPV